MKILIVEDELKVLSFLQKGLTHEGHVVDTAMDGEEGQILATTGDYDVIILDVMLPKINGLILCKRLREAHIKTPILMLTARDTVRDKVQGLDLGADDYMTKPFSFEELLARVKALARRQDRQTVFNQLQVSDLVLDLNGRSCRRANQEIELSNKEFALLEYLMRNSGTVVTRAMISEHVWDIQFETFTNVIDVYVNYLRNKVDGDEFATKLIHTVRGRGYILREQHMPQSSENRA